MALNDVKNLMDFITPMKAAVPLHETNGNHNETTTPLNNVQNNARTLDLFVQEKLLAKDKEMVALQEQLEAEKRERVASVQVNSSLMAINQQLMEDSIQAINDRESELEEAFQKLREAEGERDSALKDIAGVENSFAELHGRYEKLKAALEQSKACENDMHDRLVDSEERLRQQNATYEALKSKAEEAFESVQIEREHLHHDKEKEMNALRVQAKRSEMRANGLQSQLDQKIDENQELAKMLDEFTS